MKMWHIQNGIPRYVSAEVRGLALRYRALRWVSNYCRHFFKNGVTVH